jgi:hypothetical protein|uniref:Acyloxyacyl hydrolase n=1 Tax=Desulfobacca acetoxidans TaxID=60893 RepID=A0A7C5ALG6_9BACT
MQKKKVAFLSVFMVLVYLWTKPSLAKAAEFHLADCHYLLGLRLAYGHHLGSPKANFYSLLPRWGVLLVRPGGAHLGGVGLSFEIEGIVSVAEAEDTGYEIGFTPLVKLTFPLSPGLHLFFEGGAGIIGENFRHPTVPHAFNFTPQVGAGLEIALASRLGLNLAYRFRHSSNAGIYKENPAFNVQFFQVGISYFY